MASRLALAGMLAFAGAWAAAQGEAATVEAGQPGADAIQAEIASAQESGNVHDEADARIRFGQRLMISGRIAESISQFETAESLAEKADDARLHGRALGNLGIALNHAGLHGEALSVQQRALTFFESVGDITGTASVTVNIGATLDELGDAEGSRRYLERALELKRQHNVERGVGSILNNLADIEEREGSLAQAERLLREALASHERSGNPNGAVLAQANLGRILARSGDIAGALDMAVRAETQAREQDFLIGRLTAQTAQVEALLRGIQAGDLPGNRARLYAQRAGTILEDAIAAAASLGDDGRQSELSRLLSDVRKAQGRLPEALELLHASTELHERQHRRINADRVAVMAARFEQERQAREIAVLREGEARQSAELGRQRSVLTLLGMLLVLAATVFAVAVQRLRNQRRAEALLARHNMELSTALEQARLERQRAEAYAQRQSRFLNLASNDMRRPLVEIRAAAEHALVVGNEENRMRAYATVAQGANDLLWVTDQMLESASLPEGDDPLDGVHPVDAAVLLRDLAVELSPRAASQGHELRLCIDGELPRMAIRGASCVVALRELVMILLHMAPPRAGISIAARVEGHRLRIGISDPSGQLPEWEGEAAGDEGATRGFALAWIRQAILDSDGEIRNETVAGLPRQVAILLPAVAHPASAPGA